MSHVRMCDRCGTVFPEGAEGSSVGTATRTATDPSTGRRVTENVQRDECPNCAQGTAVPTFLGQAQTRPAITAKDE